MLREAFRKNPSIREPRERLLLAARVYSKLGFGVLPRLEELQQPKNVHFKAEGSRVMAVQVAAYITEALR